MCGISGLYAPSLSESERKSAAARMVRAIAHRGPDANAVYSDASDAVVLGHNRLSIIDLSDTGAQPMRSPDTSKIIAFNGEVYNFTELRHELASGRDFAGHSDTEVVLAAYEKWGVKSFARLNGMFAMALLDRERRKLVLVRDRLGIKPLYFARSGSTFTFGSEIKSILASGVIPTERDPRWLGEFLYFGNTLGARTLYSGIEQLLPGHYLELDLDSGVVEPLVAYWDVNALVPLVGLSESDAIDRTRELLEAAVKRQLASDVPVGTFLSGGVDSSAIVALASRHYESRLRTYTVGFDFNDHQDEIPLAREIAQRFGTDHHELHVTSGRIVETIERLAEAHDQPFADAANLPLFQLCQALGGETKVILQGDGGDELFGGYRRYPYLRAGAFGRAGAHGIDRLLDAYARAGGSRMQGGHRFFHALSQKDPAIRMALLLTVEGHGVGPTAILSEDIRHIVESHDAFARYREIARKVRGLPDLQAMLHTDLQILLPDIFLQKVDRSTMASSIEVRVPFLDFDLVDFAAALPDHFKVGLRTRKKLLRKALAGIVPDHILHGKKKGLGVPVASWLAGPLKDYAYERIMAQAGPNGWLSGQSIRQLFSEHETRRRDHSQLLWKALQLALWLERPIAAPAP